MGTPLRVLIVEDSEDDELLLIRELRRGGYDETHKHEQSAGEGRDHHTYKTGDHQDQG